jgi:hypothetical protein
MDEALRGCLGKRTLSSVTALTCPLLGSRRMEI